MRTVTMKSTHQRSKNPAITPNNKSVKVCTCNFTKPCSYFKAHYGSEFKLLITKDMGERYNIHSQLEHLQSKYIGTGHADTSKFEWLVNQHRDSLSSYIAHHDMLNFFAIAENESKARIRFNLTKKMLSPCGPPPERLED